MCLPVAPSLIVVVSDEVYHSGTLDPHATADLAGFSFLVTDASRISYGSSEQKTDSSGMSFPHNSFQWNEFSPFMRNNR